MSGVELIVGAVLGGIPVVLEAYDRYWAISRALSTFRHHSKELLSLDAALDTQKALFRSTVALLLRVVMKDPEQATGLLGSPGPWPADSFVVPHSTSKMTVLEELFNAWKRVLDQVHGSLQSICGTVEDFRSSREDTPGQMDWTLRSRLKLCFKQSDVQSDVGKLREFMNDFRNLTSQIIQELGQIKSSSDQNRPRLTASHLTTLDKYRRIRTASSRLYETVSLRWPCATHPGHAASISFQDKGAERGVKFSVAMGSRERGSAPLWLDIEYIDMGPGRQASPPPLSTSTEVQDPRKAVFDIVKDLEEHGQPMVIRSPPPPKKLVKRPKDVQTTGVLKKLKAVRFQTSAADSNPQPAASEDEDCDSATAIPAQNLERVSDFCQHFQNRALCGSDCIGYIRHSGLHRFYLPSIDATTDPRNQTNLADVIERIARDGTLTLPRRAAVRVAGTLASAVLQYHATPWLPEVWESSHVQYFGTNLIQNHENIGLPEQLPYFGVELSRRDGMTNTSPSPGLSLAAPDTKAHQDTSKTAVARNPSLFCLGIVLLELAYCKPWPSLCEPVLERLEPTKRTAYHAAERLAQSTFLRDRMWPGYSDIVCKLLGCDFGLGKTDLEDERLQEAFLVDVVSVLQRAEVRLAELSARMSGL